MLLASKAGFANWVHLLTRFHNHSRNQIAFHEPLSVLSVQMAESSMPECLIKCTCANSACKFGGGHNLPIQMSCIVGIDGCSEQKTILQLECNASRVDEHIVLLFASEIQD